MTKKIGLTVELISEPEGGYTVYCPELDIYTQGEDRDDALRNFREAAQLHIEEIGLANLKLREVKEEKLEMTFNA